MDVHDELAFWAMVIAESKKTVFCPVGLYDQVIELLRTHQVEHLYIVQTHQLDEATIYVVDSQALDAGLREQIQHATRRFLQDPETHEGVA